MADELEGAPSTYNDGLSLFCRAAGDQIPVSFDGNIPEIKLFQGWHSFLSFFALSFGVICSAPIFRCTSFSP
jgi:hypothetical protein